VPEEPAAREEQAERQELAGFAPSQPYFRRRILHRTPARVPRLRSSCRSFLQNK